VRRTELASTGTLDVTLPDFVRIVRPVRRRLLTACCLSDMLRIYAPKTPFPDDKLKVRDAGEPRGSEGSATAHRCC
jgi:hypothetical protein